MLIFFSFSNNSNQELAALKKALEEETAAHELSLAETRHKHSQETSEIYEQLDVVKKNKAALEKMKATLEAENADMANEIRTLQAGPRSDLFKKKENPENLFERKTYLQSSS